jgi:hypothetical protein
MLPEVSGYAWILPLADEDTHTLCFPPCPTSFSYISAAECSYIPSSKRSCPPPPPSQRNAELEEDAVRLVARCAATMKVLETTAQAPTKQLQQVHLCREVVDSQTTRCVFYMPDR